MHIQTYLINLESSSDRLEEMAFRLRKIGVEFQRVPAFDGRGIDLETLSAFPDADIDACLAFMGRPFHGGEFGCYKSHLDCARRIVECGVDQALVLEDDVELSPDLLDTVHTIISLLSANNFDWDLVHLGPDRLKYTTDVGYLDESRRKLVHAHYFPMTTSALLWNRQGASRFLAEHSIVKMPVDNQFREYLTRSNRGFAVWPALALQTARDSTINPSGIPDMRKRNRRWNYGYLKQRRLITNKFIARRGRRRSRRKIELRPFIDAGVGSNRANGSSTPGEWKNQLPHPKAYIINLDSGKDRMRAASEQLNEAGIEFERVAAYDGRNLSHADLESFPDADTETCLRFMGWEMYGAEYGVYKSHLECVRKIFESGAPYGLVFEDDVIVHPLLLHHLDNALDLLGAVKADWDVIHLSPVDFPIGLTTKIGETGLNHTLIRAHYFPMTAGALLWSRRGARDFSTRHATVKMPFDRYLREILTRSNRGYAVWPPLVQQSWSDSQIDVDGTMYDERKRFRGRWLNRFIKKRIIIANRTIAGLHRFRAILSKEGSRGRNSSPKPDDFGGIDKLQE